MPATIMTMGEVNLCFKCQRAAKERKKISRLRGVRSVALPNSMAVTRTIPMTEAVMPSRNGATMDHAQAELTAKTHF